MSVKGTNGKDNREETINIVRRLNKEWRKLTALVKHWFGHSNEGSEEDLKKWIERIKIVTNDLNVYEDNGKTEYNED